MGMFRSSRRDTSPDYDLLMPEAPAAKQNRPRTQREAVDADFTTIRDITQRGYGNDNRPAGYQQRKVRTVGAFDAVQSMIAWADRKLTSLSVDGYSAIVAAAVVGVFLLSGGFTMVPQQKDVMAAAPEPLAITHISITPEDAGGMEVLLINGIVENASSDLQTVPMIRADLFVTKGEKVASMLIEPQFNQIAPGQSQGFSARLRHPGGKLPEIKLSFAGMGASER